MEIRIEYAGSLVPNPEVDNFIQRQVRTFLAEHLLKMDTCDGLIAVRLNDNSHFDLTIHCQDSDLNRKLVTALERFQLVY